MKKNFRPTKSPYQIEKEQISFFLENIEKKTWRIQKNKRGKRHATGSSKKNLQGAKNSYQKLTKENKELKE